MNKGFLPFFTEFYRLPVLTGPVPASLPAQAGGLPESSQGSSVATPLDRRSNNLEPTLAGSQNPGIPSGCIDPTDCLPGVSAPLRPLATLCQPSGLKTPSMERDVAQRTEPQPSGTGERTQSGRSESPRALERERTAV